MFDPWAKTPAPGQCQQIVDDYERGTRYNLVRVYVVPKQRPCLNKAKGQSKDGRHLCGRHLKKADGLGA